MLTPTEDRDAYVADVIRSYLKHFPWDLDPATERTPDELAEVNDKTAEVEDIDPVPGAPGFEKAAEEKKKRNEYELKIAEVCRFM